MSKKVYKFLVCKNCGKDVFKIMLNPKNKLDAVYCASCGFTHYIGLVK